MRVLSVILVVVLLCTGVYSVRVKVGKRCFPFKAVKDLKELMTLDEENPQLTKQAVEAACTDVLLPSVFQPVCDNEVERKAVFYGLVEVFKNIDRCETCAFTPCTGC